MSKMDLRDLAAKSKYEDDDSEDLRGRRYKSKGAGFFTATRIFMLFLLVIGIVIGTFVQHQYIEPLLNKELNAQNASLQSLAKLLNEQNDKLLIDLNACRAGIDLDTKYYPCGFLSSIISKEKCKTTIDQNIWSFRVHYEFNHNLSG